MRRAIGGTPLEMVVDVLIARKRRLYGADWRIFSVATVELQGGTMWVRVDAGDGRR